MKPLIRSARLAFPLRRYRNRPTLETCEARTLLTTMIDVTTFADVVNPGDGVTSLREAISQANNNAALDDYQINLQTGTYAMSIAGPGEDANASGDFDVTNTLRVVGQGSDKTLINVLDLDRIFDIHSGFRFTASGLGLYNGQAIGGGGGGIRTLRPVDLTDVLFSGNDALAAGSFDHTANGGGLYIREDVMPEELIGILSLEQSFLDNCLFLSNVAHNLGGGIAIERHDVTIENSRFAENRSDYSSGGAIHQGIAGEGSSNPGPGILTLVNTTLEDNRANSDGGGINFFADKLNISNSRIINNNATRGGGILIQIGGGSFTIDSSTISGNSADEVANGIYMSTEGGDLTITNSTIANNTGARYEGGGLYLYTGAEVAISNSTISGNACEEYGGGIYSRYSRFSLFHVTLTDNSAATGGGIYIDEFDTLQNWVETTNSIIAGNTATEAPDISGEVFTEFGHNLLGPQNGWTYRLGSDENNLVGVDPLLAPLADNGGTTLTHNLLPDSPAIDAATDLEGTWLSPDQRGVVRPQPPGGIGDIGAVEYIGTIVDTIPPTVGGLMRYGYHSMPTTLVVMFSEPMNVRSVIDTDNYILLAHLRHHRGQIVGKRIPVTEVVYDTQMNAVAIRPARRLPLHLRYQITLLSYVEDDPESSNGLRDVAGNPLDGNANGIGGDNYVRIFGNDIWQKPVNGQPATPVVIIPGAQPETPTLPRLKFRVPKR